MKNRILIVHGWLHSVDRYTKLKEDLEIYGCNVTLYKLQGFGGVPAKYYFNILNHYVDDLVKEIESSGCDIVIGHSMGGNLLLKVFYRLRVKPKLILLAPVYQSLYYLRPLIMLYPLLLVSLVVLCKSRCGIINNIICTLAKFTVEDLKHMDKLIVKDVRRANPLVTLNTLIELIWDSYSVREVDFGESIPIVLYGSRDRIIKGSSIRRLCCDLDSCILKVVDGVGHTLVLENYNSLLSSILDVNELKGESVFVKNSKKVNSYLKFDGV